MDSEVEDQGGQGVLFTSFNDVYLEWPLRFTALFDWINADRQTCVNGTAKYSRRSLSY